ncbi:hypothetical protein K438DRAFT_1971714 [Mycena galopus ATCC 62051]|nr:hypothetical protein K438DRAFT_1971714 [Mycena galopus ATCC 62051]
MADRLYFIVSPNPGAPNSPRYQTNTGSYFYVKFGDGGGNDAAYRRANPDYRLEENAGVDPNSQITFTDPGSGKQVTQRYAKYLEKNLLIRHTQAHGGGSEWYKMSPAGALTAQQLATNLNTLLTSFAATDLEHHTDVFLKQFETLTQSTV